MRAIVKPKPGPGLAVQDVPKPTCGPADVLIKVRNAGVCGTDLHIAEWDAWAQGRVKPPAAAILAIVDAPEALATSVPKPITMVRTPFVLSRPIESEDP